MWDVPMPTLNRKRSFILGASMSLMVMLPFISEAAAPKTFKELTDIAINVINSGVAVTLVLGIVIYFYGVATHISSYNEKGSSAFRLHFFWGIIALFVMFSVWGILEIVQNTIFNGGAIGTGSGAAPASFCSGLDNCSE